MTTTIDRTKLAAACARAAESVYSIDTQTPVEPFELPDGTTVHLKREDTSQIRSYKWRGAFHKLSACVARGDRGPFVATSAGNHAQGVARAAAALGVRATVFMPRTTPLLKQQAVRRHGADWAEVRLVGDSFEEALAAAMKFATETAATVIPPFDDLDVIAGQSTVGLELLEQLPQLQTLFVPVGGGGLASGVSFIIKHRAAEVRVIGVEVAGQDSMSRSRRQPQRVSIDDVDRFCDGTAVATPGALTWQLCEDHLDEMITVSNEQVCAAIQMLWEGRRLVPEPSGAIGLAGLLHARREGRVDPARESCAAIITGGNVDFLTLPLIVQRSQFVQPTRRYFRFSIEERNGSLIDLLDQFLDDINIVDFCYGKSGHAVAVPVLGLTAQPEQFELFEHGLTAAGQHFEEVTDHGSTLFRVIPFRPDLITNPCFLHIDFPDRPGALRELMREVSSLTSICYFNFNDTGQSEGHALIGFEFDAAENEAELLDVLERLHFAHRRVDMRALTATGPA